MWISARLLNSSSQQRVETGTGCARKKNSIRNIVVPACFCPVLRTFHDETSIGLSYSRLNFLRVYLGGKSWNVNFVESKLCSEIKWGMKFHLVCLFSQKIKLNSLRYSTEFRSGIPRFALKIIVSLRYKIYSMLFSFIFYCILRLSFVSFAIYHRRISELVVRFPNFLYTFRTCKSEKNLREIAS